MCIKAVVEVTLLIFVVLLQFGYRHKSLNDVKPAFVSKVACLCILLDEVFVHELENLKTGFAIKPLCVEMKIKRFGWHRKFKFLLDSSLVNDFLL